MILSLSKFQHYLSQIIIKYGQNDQSIISRIDSYQYIYTFFCIKDLNYFVKKLRNIDLSRLKLTIDSANIFAISKDRKNNCSQNIH